MYGNTRQLRSRQLALGTLHGSRNRSPSKFGLLSHVSLPGHHRRRADRTSISLLLPAGIVGAPSRELPLPPRCFRAIGCSIADFTAGRAALLEGQFEDGASAVPPLPLSAPRDKTKTLLQHEQRRR